MTSADFVLAGIRPGSDSSVVRQRLGQPDSVHAAENPLDTGSKLLTWIYPHLVIHFFSTNHVVGVWTKDPSVHTARGLHVGDSAERLRRLYGAPSGSFEDEWDYEDANQELHAIRVTVKNGRITEIYVGSILD